MAEREAELDALYALPLDEFTSARNELARRLAREDRDAAAHVKALPKPTLATWTINQLARRRAKLVSALLDAGDALRKAQRSALSGGGSDDVRAAAAARTDAVRALVDAGRGLLLDEGLKASGATLERVATTLRSASVDDEGRRLLEQGRLASELAAGGFEALGGLAAPARPKARRRQPERNAAEERRRLRALESEARRLEREAQAAEREADEAEAAAAEARARARAARADANEARERAESAKPCV